MRVKTVVLRTAVTSFLLLATLLLFEFYLRREATYIVSNNLSGSHVFLETDPELLVLNTARGRRLVPNADVVINNHYMSGYDIRVKTNSLGFRDSELKVPKPANETRLMFLGDSVTLNDYLPAEQSYTELIETVLSDSLPGKNIEVINASVGNIGIEEELEILGESAASVAPDSVIISFYLNDSRPPWGFSGEIGNRGWLRRHSLIAESIYRKLREKTWEDDKKALRFGWIEAKDKLSWATDKRALLELAQMAQYDWGAAWQEPSWQLVQQELEKFKKASAEFKFSPGLVIFPVSFQVLSNYMEDTPQQKLKNIAKALDIPILDLLPTLREHAREDLYYDHCHLTAYGNRVAAKALAPFVLEQLL